MQVRYACSVVVEYRLRVLSAKSFDSRPDVLPNLFQVDFLKLRFRYECIAFGDIVEANNQELTISSEQDSKVHMDSLRLVEAT